MDWVWIAISVLGSLYSIIRNVSTDASAQAYRKKLAEIQQEVSMRNSVNSATISKLNGLLQQAYSIRGQIDPRLIPKLDQSINKYNDAITRVQTVINTNQAQADKISNSIKSPPSTIIDNVRYRDELNKNENKFKPEEVNYEQTIQQIHQGQENKQGFSSSKQG